MKINLDREVFKDIDSAFSKLMQVNSDKGATRSISRSLKKVFPEIDIDVVVVKNKDKDHLFIMSIYPDKSTIDLVVKAIIDEASDEVIREAWNGAKKWTIEIDSKILNNSIIKTGIAADELTAILLHELGHVVYSNSIPQRISKVMRLEYARASVEVKKLMHNKIFSQLLELPILHACMFDNYKTSDKIGKELKADVFVVKMGYRDQLSSVLGKIIALNDSTNRKTGEINQSSADVYNDMKSITLFSIHTVEQLKKRQKKVVRSNFDKLMLDSSSETIRKSISSILSNLLRNDGDELTIESFGGDVVRKAVSMMETQVYQEFFNRDTKKMDKIPSDLVDQIAIMASDIKTNNDKIILVSYIYSKIDLINYYISLIDSSKSNIIIPHTKDYLVDLLSRLERQKNDIMKYPIPEINYSLNVAYPDGYEG